MASEYASPIGMLASLLALSLSSRFVALDDPTYPTTCIVLISECFKFIARVIMDRTAFVKPERLFYVAPVTALYAIANILQLVAYRYGKAGEVTVLSQMRLPLIFVLSHVVKRTSVVRRQAIVISITTVALISVELIKTNSLQFSMVSCVVFGACLASSSATILNERLLKDYDDSNQTNRAMYAIGIVMNAAVIYFTSTLTMPSVYVLFNALCSMSYGIMVALVLKNNGSITKQQIVCISPFIITFTSSVLGIDAWPAMAFWASTYIVCASIWLFHQQPVTSSS